MRHGAAWLAAIVLVGGIGSSLLWEPSKPARPPMAASAPGGSPGFEFVVAPTTVTSAVNVRGQLGPRRVIAVASPVDAPIREIKFDFGQKVSEGTPLVLLDTTQAEVELRRARAELITAETRYAEVKGWATSAEVNQSRRALQQADTAVGDAQHRLDQSKFLAEKGIIAGSEVEAGEQAVASARMQQASAREMLQATLRRGDAGQIKLAEYALANAKEGVERAGEKIERAVIKAPATGIVLRPPDMDGSATHRAAMDGATVHAGDALFAVADLSGFSVDTSVDEYDVGKVQAGQPVQLIAEAQNGLTMVGQVAEVALQPSTGGIGMAQTTAYAIRIVIDNVPEAARAQLRLGASVVAKIVIYEKPAALIIPAAAIQIIDGKPTVTRIAADNSHQPVPVDLGLVLARGTEIVNGLQAGDRLWVPGS
jgi:multidrug resistance efflux pump